MSDSPCDSPPGWQLLGQPNGERVRFQIESDESALRIEAVLGALGFDVIRDHSSCRGDLFGEVARASAHRYHLTERERLVLDGILRGRTDEQIGAGAQLSTATIEWVLHNLQHKLDVSSREGVLRRVLRLDDLCWLREPRLQRDALERLEIAVHTVRDQLRAAADHDLDDALQLLDDALTGRPSSSTSD